MKRLSVHISLIPYLLATAVNRILRLLQRELGVFRQHQGGDAGHARSRRRGPAEIEPGIAGILAIRSRDIERGDIIESLVAWTDAKQAGGAGIARFPVATVIGIQLLVSHSADRYRVNIPRGKTDAEVIFVNAPRNGPESLDNLALRV